jgi:hypothetical protein
VTRLLVYVHKALQCEFSETLLTHVAKSRAASGSFVGLSKGGLTNSFEDSFGQSLFTAVHTSLALPMSTLTDSAWSKGWSISFIMKRFASRRSDFKISSKAAYELVATRGSLRQERVMRTVAALAKG